MPLNIVNNILSFQGFVQSFNGIQKYSLKIYCFVFYNTMVLGDQHVLKYYIFCLEF